jgi:hypothetical protein
MKTNTPFAVASFLLIWLLTLTSASAFYDPGAQRWINRDPIAEQGGVNLTGFVFNAPLNLVDLFGLEIVVVPPGWQGPPKPGDTIIYTKFCEGEARVLQGNKNLIGRPGGFRTRANPMNVTAESAAVDPAQWGGRANLRPNLDKISGTLTDFSGKQIGSFSGIRDVIGGKPPKGMEGMNVRDALKKLNPGKLIVELPGAANGEAHCS